MRPCSVSTDLEPLSAILQWTSCPSMLFLASSLASPLTHLGGSSTTPPRVVFCPLRTSRLTTRCLTTVSFPTALPLSPPCHSSSHHVLLIQGPAPSGVSQVDHAEPIDSGAARGAEPAGARTGGAEPGGADLESVELGGTCEN
ncbi:unnamed protein product [Closterium sp. NIES-54]